MGGMVGYEVREVEHSIGFDENPKKNRKKCTHKHVGGMVEEQKRTDEVQATSNVADVPKLHRV